MARPPLPPFTEATAIQKVRLAEDAWNTRDPERVAGAYTEDSRWRNRAEFFQGRAEIIAFLRRKWARELEYRLIKELWAFHGNHIAVRFQSTNFATTPATGSAPTATSSGNSTTAGLMRRREASINDVPIGARRPAVPVAAAGATPGRPPRTERTRAVAPGTFSPCRRSNVRRDQWTGWQQRER